MTSSSRLVTIHRIVLVALVLLAGTPVRGQSLLLEDEANTVAVFEKASRGVVHINARYVEESPFDKYISEGQTGTGFVLDGEGRILTAFHVIRGMNEIEAVLGSRKRLRARIVGTSPQLDLALLQVDAIITAINGQQVDSAAQIAQLLLASRPGQTLRLTVYRQGQVVELAIHLDKMRM